MQTDNIEKRIASVDSTDLVSNWIDKTNNKIEYIKKSPDGYIDIEQTIVSLIENKVILMKNINDSTVTALIYGLATNSIYFIEGVPGTGKTESIKILKTILTELDIDTKVITINLAAMEPSDVVGDQLIDPIDKKTTKFIVNEIYADMLQNKDTVFIFFLDEMNRAKPDMMHISMKLIDGELNPNTKMKPNTYIVAAGNMGIADNTEAIAFEDLDDAIKDRVTKISHIPSFTTWYQLNLSNKEIDNGLLELLNKNANSIAIKEFIFCNDILRFITPRRLTMFCKQISIMKKLGAPIDLLKDTVLAEMNRLDVTNYINSSKNIRANLPSSILQKTGKITSAKTHLITIFEQWFRHGFTEETELNIFSNQFMSKYKTDDITASPKSLSTFRKILTGEENLSQALQAEHREEVISVTEENSVTPKVALNMIFSRIIGKNIRQIDMDNNIIIETINESINDIVGNIMHVNLFKKDFIKYVTEYEDFENMSRLIEEYLSSINFVENINSDQYSFLILLHFMKNNSNLKITICECFKNQINSMEI